jgi:hypothetical protein
MGERVKGVFAQVVNEVGNEMEGFELTLIFTVELLWHLLLLVTVRETVVAELGLREIAEVVAPVFHRKVWVEALNFVSNVMEFDWQTSTAVGRLITGFDSIAIDVETKPVQPLASVAVTE